MLVSSMANDLLIGFGGAVVGGLFAVGAAYQSHRYNLTLERQRTQETIDGILQAIRIEWQVMLKEYEWLGERLAEVKQGETFTYFFKITRDYFIVYPNNTSIVGQINDAELCRQIVVAYTRASTFIDAIEVNNANVERLREFETHCATVTLDASTRHQMRMIEFVPLLRQAYQELKQDAEKLTKAIDNYRQRHPVKMD
jgi:hypothetical protein